MQQQSSVAAPNARGTGTETGSRLAPHAGGGEAWPSPRYAWYVVSVLMLAYAFAMVDRIVLSVLVPLIQKDLGLNDTQIALLGGLAFSVTYTLFGLPVGWMADRFNRRNIIMAGVTVWSVATALCGAAGNFWQLFLARVGVGVGEATLQPSATSMIADYFPPESRSKAMGIFVLGTSLGTAAAFLLVGAIIAAVEAARPSAPWLEGWRTWEVVFVAVGLPGLIVTLLMLTVREPLRRERVAGSAQVPISEVRRFMVANRQTFIAHHVGVMLVFLAIYGQLLFLPSYFIRVHGWSPTQIAFDFGLIALTAGASSAITAGWMAAWLAKRGRSDATLYVALLGVIGSCTFGGLASIAPTGGLALAGFTGAAFFANWPSVGALSGINQIVPNQMRAQVTAVYTLVVGLLAAGTGPLVVGFLTDAVFQDKMKVGLSMAVTFAACGILASGLLAWGLPHFRKTAEAARSWSGT